MTVNKIIEVGVVIKFSAERNPSCDSVKKCQTDPYRASRARVNTVLLFLPDSHSAYYDSFVSALGRSLPPLTGSFKDLLHLDKFLVEMEGGAGGWGWAHPPALATLGKMALEASVGFLGIGLSD